MILLGGKATARAVARALETYASSRGCQVAKVDPTALTQLEADHRPPGSSPLRCVSLFTSPRSVLLAGSPAIEEDELAEFLHEALGCPAVVGLSPSTPGVDDMEGDDGMAPGDFIALRAWGKPTPTFKDAPSGWDSEGASAVWRLLDPSAVPLASPAQRALVAAWNAARPAGFEALGLRLSSAARAGPALVVELEAPSIERFSLHVEPCPRTNKAQAAALIALAVERLEWPKRGAPEDPWTPAPAAVLRRLHKDRQLRHVTGLARAGLPAFTKDSLRRLRVESSLAEPEEFMLEGVDWVTDAARFVANVRAELRERELTASELEASAAAKRLGRELNEAIQAGDVEEAARCYRGIHADYYAQRPPQVARQEARAKATELIALMRRSR